MVIVNQMKLKHYTPLLDCKSFMLYYWYMKICLYCKKEFVKKFNHSKKYWETAKYCSRSCGRLSNNPASKKTNDIVVNEDSIAIIIKYKDYKHYFIVDTEDYINKEVNKKRWIYMGGYAYFSYTNEGGHKKKSLHRIIMGDKDGYVVDHINGNTFDNRKSNLRYLSHKDNVRNQHIKNKNNIPGCQLMPSGKYRVRIRSNSKEIHVGTFDNKQEALKKRIEAEINYWGKSFTQEKI